jgi:lycopene beta-cyclase
VINIGTWRLDQSQYVTLSKSDKNQVNWLPFYKEKPTSLNFIKTKFWFYDLLLLDILDRKTNWVLTFSSMFKKRKSCGYFQISRRGNLFIEDIQVILKCPKMLFIKAIFNVAASPKITIKL